jgi:hypothetical protein
MGLLFFFGWKFQGGIAGGREGFNSTGEMDD